MLKHIQGWDITKAVNNEHKAFARNFAGGKNNLYECQAMFPRKQTFL